MNRYFAISIFGFLIIVAVFLTSGCGPVTAIPSPTFIPAQPQSQTATATPNQANTLEMVQPYGILIFSNSKGIYAFNIRTRETSTLFTENDYYFDDESVKHGNGYIYFISSTSSEAKKDSYPSSSDIFRMKIDGGELIQLTSTGGSKLCLSISPNGKYLTYIDGQDQMFILDVQTSDTKVIATSIGQTRVHGFFFAAWSSDSNRIAFFELQQGGGYSQLYVFSFENNSLIPVLPEGTVPVTSLAWSPDDKSLILSYYENDERGIYSFDLQLKTLSQVVLTDEYPQNLIQSPDGKLILFELKDLNRQTKLNLLNIATNEVDVIRYGASSSATWSPDGNYIVYSTGSGRNWNLNIVEIRTKEIIEIAYPEIVKSSASVLWLYP